MNDILQYTVHYYTLKSRDIFNMCGPEHKGPYQWDEEGLALRKKNADAYIQEMNDRNGHYEKLEKSILEQGIISPILVNAGFCQPRKFHMLPPEMQEDSSKILFCHSSGGSRLYIAAKHDMDIWCIVSDFTGDYTTINEIKNEMDLLTYYAGNSLTPVGIEFGEFGLTIKDMKRNVKKKPIRRQRRRPRK